MISGPRFLDVDRDPSMLYMPHLCSFYCNPPRMRSEYYKPRLSGQFTSPTQKAPKVASSPRTQNPHLSHWRSTASSPQAEGSKVSMQAALWLQTPGPRPGHGTWWILCQTPGEYHRVRDPFDHQVGALVNSSKYIIVFLESMSRPLHVQVVAN